MNVLAWNAPPPLAALAAAVEACAAPLYLVVCLPENRLPVFRPSENPSPPETALAQALAGKLGCIQFNTANAIENILPDVHLWLMPPDAAARLGEHFAQPPQWQTEAVPQLPPPRIKPWFRPSENRAAPTRALVIGAGIAGAATARALAQHGLPVTVIEAARPAHAASGNRQGLLYAKISPHNTSQTELLLCGYGHTRRLLETLLPQRTNWGGNGVIHLNHNDEETQRNRLLSLQTRHAHLYRGVDAAQAAQIAGIPLTQGGLYWPQGVWIHPPALVEALLDHPLIELHTQTPVLSARRNGGAWQVQTPAGAFNGSHIVYCMGAASPQAAAADAAALPYRLIRGQTDLAAATACSEQLRCALSAASYVSPAWQGVHCFGATFVQHDTGCGWRETDAETNRQALYQLHHGLAESLFSDGLRAGGARPSESPAAPSAQPLCGHAALRCDSPDHLPLAGALGDIRAMNAAYAKLALDKNYRIDTPCPYLPDAYINTAHGSRGLATAPICAAAVAADILGLPTPLPQRLREALSPNRTIIRALIRQQPLSPAEPPH